MTAYLNVAEFGNGIYGIDAAAHHYFDKSAANLNRDESALLIAMLTNPKYYEDNQGDRALAQQATYYQKTHEKCGITASSLHLLNRKP